MNNQLKTVLLLALLSAALISLGGLAGTTGLWLATGFALVLNVGAYFFSDRLALRMSGARELPLAELPGLHAAVEELAARAGIPKPRVYVIDADYANAFATGRNPAHGAVAVTRGLLGLLDARELRAVLAHEIGHIRNRDVLISTLAAVCASAIASLSHMIGFGLLGGSSDEESPGIGGALLALVAAPLAATLVQMGLSRTREYLADDAGAELTGDPEALARALLKLQRGAEVAQDAPAHEGMAGLYVVNPFAGLGASAARWLSTHPPTELRVARLLGSRSALRV
jgi:heat shock protein HtpX